MKAGLLFPGQGAQSPGMGKEIASTFPAAGRVFEQADDILESELSQLCFEGPGEDLTRTDKAQPAIYVCSMAVLAALEESMGEALQPTMAGGLSLGEYTALAVTGALSFEEGLRLVALRGRAMQEASDALPSGMTSVLGLDRKVAEELCATVAHETGKIIQVANLNSPGQIVVSGENEALDLFESRAPESGARRAVRLDVAGAFHSEVMRPASDALGEALESATFREPSCPIWQNATALPSSDPSTLKENLASQLTSAVLWEDSFRGMASESGDETFLEPAPGRVLAGLARRIAPETTVISLQEPQDLQALATA